MKKIVSLMLTVVLCLACAVTVFADTEYKVGRDVEFSGQTDFDYFYTYTDKDVNYKCFSVVSAEGQRFYAAVKENLYEYYRATFAGQSLTLMVPISVRQMMALRLSRFARRLRLMRKARRSPPCWMSCSCLC